MCLCKTAHNFSHQPPDMFVAHECIHRRLGLFHVFHTPIATSACISLHLHSYHFIYFSHSTKYTSNLSLGIIPVCKEQQKEGNGRQARNHGKDSSADGGATFG
jgi:hypothetical protein